MALQVLLPLLGMLGAGAAAKLGIDKIAADENVSNDLKKKTNTLQILQQLQSGIPNTGNMPQQNQPMQAPDMSQPYMDTSLVAEPQTQTASAPGKATAMPTQVGPPPRFSQAGMDVTVEEPNPLEKPIRFRRPMQISNVGINADGNISYSMKPDTAAMDAQFTTAFGDVMSQMPPTLTPGEARQKTFFDLVEQFGYFPSDSVSKQLMPDWDKVQESTYMKLSNALRMDPKFRAAIKAQNPGSTDADILVNSYIAAGQQMNGYMPDDIRSTVDAVVTAGAKSYSTAMGTERAARESFGGPQGALSREAQKASATAYSRGMGTERAEAESFWGNTGPLARQAASTIQQRALTPPRVPAGEVGNIGQAQSFGTIANRTVDTMMGYIVDKNGGVNLDRLPVGPVGEVFNKRMDKYGIAPDAARIQLRNGLNRMIEIMYAIRGKQLSDKEVALAQDTLAAMNESPTQFLVKFAEFQAYMRDMLTGKVEALKKADYDVGELPQMLESLNNDITNKLVSQMGYSEEDIQYTMKENNVSRWEVLQQLLKTAARKGAK